MMFNIKKDGNLFAVLGIEGGVFSIKHAPDDFRREIQEMVSRGVSAKRDIYDAQVKAHITILENIKSDHPHFVLALKQHLQGLGYEVEESHEELQKEIRASLDEFPKEDDKKTIIEKLPTMSHLELTSIQRMIDQFVGEKGHIG